eukprot:1159611-Pelagomonas_calceolata.AAC.3
MQEVPYDTLVSNIGKCFNKPLTTGGRISLANYQTSSNLVQRMIWNGEIKQPKQAIQANLGLDQPFLISSHVTTKGLVVEHKDCFPFHPASMTLMATAY